LKIAIVGCGFMGRMHANVYGALSTAELAAVLDHRPKNLEEFSTKFGVLAYSSMAELFAAEQIDAVDICLPTFLHKDATIVAARAGKHVLCEKPMALTVEDADEMIAACQQNNVRLMIAHCIRFWPEYALLKQIVDDKRLGELKSINLTRYGEYPHWSSDNWLGDASKSGGGALDMHIHDTDYVRYLLGDPCQIHSRGTVDEKGVSQIFTTMTFGSKVAHLEGGWNLPAKTPFKMTFRAIFEKGAVIMEDGPMTIYDGGEPQIPTFDKREAAGGGNISDMGGYYHEIAYFVDCVTNDKPFEVTTPKSSRESLETTLEEIRQVRENA
jgi:predicted dehydrogenase